VRNVPLLPLRACCVHCYNNLALPLLFSALYLLYLFALSPNASTSLWYGNVA
jgi:hypothetical protein